MSYETVKYFALININSHVCVSLNNNLKYQQIVWFLIISRMTSLFNAKKMLFLVIHTLHS